MWEKELWIAKRIKVEPNENGIDIETFEKPKKYYFNYQPISGYTDYMEYGERKNEVYRTFVNRCCFQGIIKVGDRVYLSDDEVCECDLEKIVLKEKVYGENANYVVNVVLPQNFKTRIDFIKR